MEQNSKTKQRRKAAFPLKIVLCGDDQEDNAEDKKQEVLIKKRLYMINRREEDKKSGKIFLHREKCRIHNAVRRANETEEERKLRIEKDRIRNRESRQRQKEAYKEQLRKLNEMNNSKAVRVENDGGNKVLKFDKDNAPIIEAKEIELAEKYQETLIKRRTYVAQKRANETPEQRKIRAEKAKLRMRKLREQRKEMNTIINSSIYSDTLNKKSLSQCDVNKGITKSNVPVPVLGSTNWNEISMACSSSMQIDIVNNILEKNKDNIPIIGAKEIELAEKYQESLTKSRTYIALKRANETPEEKKIRTEKAKLRMRKIREERKKELKAILSLNPDAFSGMNNNNNFKIEGAKIDLSELSDTSTSSHKSDNWCEINTTGNAVASATNIAVANGQGNVALKSDTNSIVIDPKKIQLAEKYHNYLTKSRIYAANKRANETPEQYRIRTEKARLRMRKIREQKKKEMNPNYNSSKSSNDNSTDINIGGSYCENNASGNELMDKAKSSNVIEMATANNTATSHNIDPKLKRNDVSLFSNINKNERLTSANKDLVQNDNVESESIPNNCSVTCKTGYNQSDLLILVKGNISNETNSGSKTTAHVVLPPATYPTSNVSQKDSINEIKIESSSKKDCLPSNLCNKNTSYLIRTESAISELPVTENSPSLKNENMSCNLKTAPKPSLEVNKIPTNHHDFLKTNNSRSTENSSAEGHPNSTYLIEVNDNSMSYFDMNN